MSVHPVLVHSSRVPSRLRNAVRTQHAHQPASARPAAASTRVTEPMCCSADARVDAPTRALFIAVEMEQRQSLKVMLRDGTPPDLKEGGRPHLEMTDRCVSSPMVRLDQRRAPC